MKKNRLAIITMVMTLVCVLLLSACGAEKDALKGTWNGISNDDLGVTWIFDGNGKCKMESELGMKQDGTYTIDGSDIKIKLSNWEDELDYTFKLDGNSLSLTPVEAFRPSYELQKK